MVHGAIQTIVVCVPSQIQQAPCPSGMGLSTAQGYVLHPDQAANFEAENAAFNYASAAGFWSMAFTFVVGLYLVTSSFGHILDRIRK